MNIYSLPAIISFTVNFSLSLIVLMEKPGNTLSRWFAAFIFSFALWNLAEVLVLNSANLSVTFLLGTQILYRIIFLVPAFYVIIAYLFPKNFNKFATNPLFYVIVFSLPILVLTLSSPDFQIKLITLKEYPKIDYYQFIFSLTPTFLILLFVSISYIVWGNVILARKIRRLRSIHLKNHTRFFATGMIIIFISSIAIVLLRASVRNPASLYFLSTILTFAIAMFLFTVVVKFHLFKPEKLLSRGATYSILSALSFVIYYFVIRAASASLKQLIGIKSSTLEGILVVALILVILPFAKLLQNLFDQIFNKTLRQYRKSMLVLFRKLQTYYETSEFFEIVTQFLISNFKISEVHIFNYQPQSGHFTEIREKTQAPPIPGDCALSTHLKHKKGATEFYDELTHRDLDSDCHRFFEDIHAQIFVPLIFEEDLLAIIVICRKKYGLEYSKDEMEILSLFGNEIAATLRRNQIIAQMRDKDNQRFRLERLAALGQLTAGLAHEIRNPLNTISTSAETLLQKDVSEEDQDELKQFILEEVNRLNRTLGDFLNIARIKPAANSEIDVENIFERVCLELQNSDVPEITVTYKIDTGEKKLMTDPDLLFQVLLNLGLNAQSAIKERCRNERNFTCSQGKINYILRTAVEHVNLSVTDNGVGIPPEIRESIYNPFFTTKESGTGLGLSIVHQIIEALSGSIEFTSRPGHTCFTIYLLKNQT